MFLFALRRHPGLRQHYEELIEADDACHLRVIRLRSPRDARRWLQGLQRRRPVLVLIRKELLGHLLSLRFGLTFACTVVLVVLVSGVGSQIFSERMGRYRANRQASEEGLAAATVYSQVRPRVILPPTPLSIFAVGVATSVTTEVTVSPFYIPDSPNFGEPTTNSDFMKAVVQVDLVTVIAIVLSFLAVALGYDSICGERERGTLRQLLSNPVPRARVMTAKLLSGWLTLAVSLAVAFVCALLVVQLNPDVHFTPVEWIRLAMLFAVSVLFLAGIFALSLMVSSLTRDSATSLVLCLFGWLAGGAVFLNLLPAAAEYAVEDAIWQTYVDASRAARQRMEEDVKEWEEVHPPPPEAYMAGFQAGDVLRFAHPRGYEWMALHSEVLLEARSGFARTEYQRRWQVHRTRAAQALAVDEWSVLSPVTAYRTLCNRLAWTTMDDRFRLAESVRRYREAFVDWLRNRNAFASRRWFTDDPPDQQPMIHDPEALEPGQLSPDSQYMRERMEWARQQNALAADDPARRLDLTGMPESSGAGRLDLSESVLSMLPGLAALLVVLVVAVTVTAYRFAEYDPT